jgi:hypothetical protein
MLYIWMYMENTFENYAIHLENLAQVALSNIWIDSYKKDILTALDGGSIHALNSAVPLDVRRKSGVFFTSSSLANKAIKGIVKHVDKSTIFLDPACGAGDLLLSCTRMLPVKRNLESTIHEWGKSLAGYDLNADFVRAAKARLYLAALLRIGPTPNKSFTYSNELFPLLKVGNCFENLSSLQTVSTIVMNPPYHLIDTPESCKWASGKVSSAAVFLDYCVNNASANSRIVAILPDVLRSGSRYANWREHILKSANIEKVILYDQFDKSTDIHVFILQLQVVKSSQNRGSSWNKQLSISNTGKVDDEFNVHVGPVVPHRDEEIGPSYPYLVAKNLPAWKVIDEIASKRKYSGTVYEPPFVVVRRTSRPEDKFRAIGTIISGDTPVAVENHLIILLPKDKTLVSCKRLLSNLRKKETNTWLDNRIRCRHLTVSALAELPWWP